MTNPQGRVAEPLGVGRDQALAVSLARDAGKMLVELQQQASEQHVGGPELKARGDKLSQDFLAEMLGRERPADAVLSEEATDNLDRLAAKRVWIIDPLDGTREFSEGRKDWAVHVALWEEGSLVAGAVALPGMGTMIGQDRPAGKPNFSDGTRLRIAVSRSRPPEFALRVAEELDAELVPMGSAGYKTWAVTAGEVDAYLHAGGQYEWDSAAPVFAARAEGMHTSRIDGTPLEYNQAHPYLPDLLVCQPHIGSLLLNAIGRALTAETEKVKTFAEGGLK
ncbi:3'(2'),5'-bisphosphate nucleotidase CysQ [Arthrobacter sp. E3]|uniref:3'(2'),5'-bisphosphate nucleotidase CysQ n=1 Tax=Arthrobacter sp. E3 TaxID=517402 RepID=UPI0032B59AE5